MTRAKTAARGLTFRIVIAMFAGGAVGTLINLGLEPSDGAYVLLVENLFRAVGALFIASLQMLVVPLVLISLVCGTSALREPARLGRVGIKTLGLYLSTTAIAVAFALLMASIVKPGQGVSIAGAAFVPTEAPPVIDVLIGMVPKNPIQAMTEANMLQVIVFAVLLGIGLTLAGEPGARIRAWFEDLDAVFMRLVMLLMQVAPYGVFALIVKVAAELGADVFQDLAKYFVLVLVTLLLHLFITYPTLLFLLTRLNPLTFLRKMRPAMLFAFSTASSNATLPVTLHTAERRLGASNAVAAFTIPLGATINMDGTAIMQGVATVFIANAYDVTLTGAQLMTVILMATLASIGTAGVPGVGLIMLAGVLSQVGLPVEAIGLVMGVDRLLDMTRTAVNITGDAMVTCVVAKSEGELDLDTYWNPTAGQHDGPT
jgi:Na+/H+-dicarboxylate symporter